MAYRRTHAPRFLLAPLAAAGALFASATPAAALTASFVNNTTFNANDAAALSSDDGVALTLGLNVVLELQTDELFAMSRANDDIAFFTLNPPGGGAPRLQIQIGVRDENGDVGLVLTNTRTANGGVVRIRNLFREECAAFGGCNFIRLVTRRENRNDFGAQIDYIEADGTVIDVAAPTPEPGAWALMLIAFGGVAARLKARRREQALAPRDLVTAIA
ncbi:MAG: PEP-CTERM sorting domain-containing protein [Parvularculaceae bacterium]